MPSDQTEQSATMDFHQAKSQLSEEEQKALDDLLENWRRSGKEFLRHAADNLINEKGSTDPKITLYLRNLAHNSLALKSEFPHKAFHESGRKFAFEGYESTPYRGAAFGRAIKLETFIRAFQRILKHDPIIIRAKLIELHGKTESAVSEEFQTYFDNLRRFPIGGASPDPVFATFMESAPYEHPWRAPLPQPDRIRNLLGLGHHLETHPLEYILLMYRLPSGISPTVPTTASTGLDFQKWFRPNPEAARQLHGRTRPLLGVGKGLPEVVHAPSVPAQIQFPFYIIGHE